MIQCSAISMLCASWFCKQKPHAITRVIHLWGYVALLSFLLSPTWGVGQTVVYQENFENNINNTATGAQNFGGIGGATQYTGTTPAGQTYTAATDWINGNNCDGVVLSANNSTLPAWANGGSNNTGNKCDPDAGSQSYNGLRTIARGMGALFGGGDNNHVVSAYTECPQGVCTTIGSGPANGLMFKTNTLIPVPANHFYTFAINVGTSDCAAPGNATANSQDPQYQFQLIDGVNTPVNVGGVLDPCGPGFQSVSATNLKTAPFTSPVTIWGQSLVANTAIFFAGTNLGVQIYSVSGTTFGNDAAFDNIVVTDVTPQMTKSFAPALVNASGGVSTLTFTITNTGDALAKTGMSFTDELVSGLTVATPTGVTTTCNGGSFSGTNAGGSTITFVGNLSAGQTSCIASVNVVASAAGTYTNGAANITKISGLIPPGTANVQFAPKLTETKTVSPTSLVAGSPATYNITIKNTGATPTADPITVTDSLPAGVTFVSATGTGWSCSGAPSLICIYSGAALTTSGAGSATTLSLNVKVLPAATGTITNTATASGGGDPNCTNSGACSSSVVTPVSVVVNLAIVKTDNTSTYTPGGTAVYIMTITNTGPSNIVGATFADSLPNGLTLNGNWTCAPASTGSCSASSGTTLAALNALTVNIPAGTPPASGTVVISVPVKLSSSPSSY